jgi:hypothetical protein
MRPLMTPVGKTAALLLACAVLLACAPSHAAAARLLVVPLSSESHISAFTALSTELETIGGHDIHMVSHDAPPLSPGCFVA